MRTNGRQRGRRRWRRETAGALRSQALVEGAAVPAVLDRQGRIIVANRALETLLEAGAAGGRRGRPELAMANRELERANAELETLGYSASHDLKSPMVSLLGYLECPRLDYGRPWAGRATTT